MSQLLRKITKGKWYPDPALAWLAEGEVPADVLTDLRTDGNELSVWMIDQDRTNLDVIVTALAAALQKVDKVDYAIFDDARLPELGIAPAVKTDGDSPHPFARSNWHRDIRELTGTKVVALAGHLMTVEHIRVPRATVKKLLLEALRAGSVERTGIDDRLLNELEQTTKPQVLTEPPEPKAVGRRTFSKALRDFLSCLIRCAQSLKA